MKQLYWSLLLLTCLGAGRLSAQTVSFNFSNGSRPVSGWVNVHGDPADSVVTTTDPVSGITISSIATANWHPYGDGSTKDDNGVAGGTYFPAAVMLNRWFTYGSTTRYSPSTPQLLISGLNKDSLYTLKMSSSSASALASDPTDYTVAGHNVYGPIGVNIHNNTANGAEFNDVSPDDSGRLKIYVNTVVGTEVADISGLQIIRQAADTGSAPIIAITSPAENDVRAEDADILFQVEVTPQGAGIQKVEYYRDTTLLGTSTTSPYSWTWSHVQVGNYTITAKVTDQQGRTSTDDVHFSVESVNYFWSTTGNIATNADTFFLGTVDTNRLAIRTNNQERVSILGDGTVGIGTKNTYGYKLAVNGSAIFTKVKVKTAGTWPDYVFEKGYALPDLEALERYLMEHKHLPDITPAAEAEREGIDVAGQQSTLLKKVEELTLYLIEENKQLKAQLKKNAEQDAKAAEQNAKIDQLQQQLEALKELIKVKQ